MKRVLIVGFLLMGFSFTVTQALLIRELLVAFLGNELSIGLILGSWLLLEAIGSGVLGRLADRRGRSVASFAVLQILFALLLPLCLGAAWTGRSLAGAIAGEGVGLVPIFWSSLLILAPVGLVAGAMFAFACRAYAHLAGAGAPAIGRVYGLEALGGLAGGLVFTFLFIPFLDSLQVVLLLASLNLLAAAAIVVSSGLSGAGRWILAAGLLLLAIAVVAFLLSPAAPEVQRRAIARQWPGYDLVFSEDSAYGNVAVVERAGQYTFYADGIPILTAPVPDVAAVEELVHLPLLFVPQPRRVLVLSGGLGGVLRELGRYPLEQIDYAELDPLLIQAARAFPTPLTGEELADPRLDIESVDGRLLVRQKAEEMAASRGTPQYDLILVNLPYPSTLQLNRFYTVEFWRMVRELLSDDGVAAVGSPGSVSYMSVEMRDLNALVDRTLQQAFPAVRPIPGDRTLWLASPSRELLAAPVAALMGRWQDRGLATSWLSPAQIRLKLGPQLLDWFRESLGGDVPPLVGGIEGGDIPPLVGGIEGGEEAGLHLGGPSGQTVNRDLRPVGLFYGLEYWNSLFAPGLSRILSFLGRLNFWILALPLFGSALLFLAVEVRTGKGRRAIVPLAVAATGLAGMAADLVIIFAFQSLYGYVYHWIGLLIAAFMAGLSLGGLLMTRRLEGKGAGRTSFLGLELVLVLYWMLLPVVLGGLYASGGHRLGSTVLQGLFFLLNALAGLLVGAQFPLANQLWLTGRTSQDGPADPGRTGVLYACDLAGAFLGAVAVGVVLIPILGIVETCLLVAALKLSSLVLVAVLPRGSPTEP